ncbi:hypothetical protein URH17368_1055 [Alicyclobacillus hesperidum URH17-3-68]|uniref:Post-transcriptional regulator n=1 Tax=Alicyclobacillus hesperidum TaxID=89784 RepID=A0A1H2Q292_9BACL|nr:post-transcriptional regulator [Alicyclobacillus hesperidum]EJY56320.1 hypothetical protein URH17368_1055 [Alicyclobacillus hesperidum URH17-3-68]GLV12845.1 hypothetical protein Heshes_05290 [Alicyclobacillus hesperidum]SDW01267.1 Post-transcriptional regulator [Alicyclobacillus hesperidum]
MDPFQLPSIAEHKAAILELCRAKIEEFKLLGYDRVEFDEFWSYIESKVRFGIQLHELVELILSVRITDYMNYLTVNAYRQMQDGLGDPPRS